ncbi:MAG: hypothetical protein BMS9Abin11_1194 [Gammaproteobacteria bacterium]|nr:MAG: hypothetical protein BMS9Abin11_1194 [Gammaproteobacteria bacterium]
MVLSHKKTGSLWVLVLMCIPFMSLAEQPRTEKSGKTNIGTLGVTLAPSRLVLSREQAVQLALQANPNVRLSAQQIAAAKARRLQAGGLDSPTLFWEWEEVKRFSPSQFGNQVIGIEQSLKWFGVRKARKRAADIGISVFQANQLRVQQRTIARIHKAFDQVLLAQENVALVGNILRRIEEAVVITRARFRSGNAQYIDVLRTRISLQRLQNLSREAMLAESRSRHRLNLLLARPANTPVELRGKLDFRSETFIPKAVLARIDNEGPSIVLLQKRIDQARQNYRVQRKNRAPEVTLSLGRQRLFDNNNIDYAWAGQVSLKFPFPGSDRQRGLEQEAQVMVETTRNRTRALLAQIRSRLRQRVNEANTLSTQLLSFREKTLLDADDQLKAARQAYSVRRIDALNLIDVYRTYLETRKNYYTLLVRYRSASIDIKTNGEDLWEIEL